MHSTTLFAPLLLLATLSSALPAPVVPLDSSAQLLDERSGNWKAPIFEALGMGRRAVVNATLEARKSTPRRIVYNPKFTGFVAEVTVSAGSASSSTSTSTQAWSAISSSSSAPPSATSSATTSSAAPSSTAKTCSVTADCAGQTIPASSHQYCASKVCSFRCNSGYTLSKGACVKNAGTTSKTTTTTVQPSSSTTTTTTTTSAAATTSAASSVTPFTGQATFFYQYGVAGACGNVNADSTPLVALDWRLYGNMGQQSQYCGRSLTITNTDNGKSVVAIVADACPSCASQYSLDLSTGAFDAIGDQDTGILPISWVWN